MTLHRKLIDWYWRLESDTAPTKHQRFAARHPVILGMRAGAGMGLLLILLGLLLAPFPGTSLTWDHLAAAGVITLSAGLGMTGVAFIERLRQKHYGYYDPPEPGRK